MTRSRTTIYAIALAVGMVLADSSIVTLALPDILREFDAEVSQVAWVLTAYNLVLALAAIPAARLARGGSERVLIGGLVLFAFASVMCALAPSLEALIAARCLQALGGAAVVCSALERLSGEVSNARAATIWGAAGVAGVAVGPALGGLLTEAISWQSIFAFQVPLALAALVVALVNRQRRPARAAEGDAGERPHIGANLALLLVSAALTAALFLLVLLMIEGWLEQPAIAGIAVTVMPLSALAAGLLAGRIEIDARTRVEAGVIAIAGGLAALALLPGANIFWTLAPQVLIGAGLGLTVQALTAAALRGRAPQAIHGGWTIAARHAGVVLGLLLLTPIFTADLEQNAKDAQLAGTAALLDSRLPPQHKIALGDAIGDRIRDADGRVPTIDKAFKDNPADSDDVAEQANLQRAAEDQIAKAATHAFSTSFWVAAVLALLALIPAALARGRMEL